MQTSQRFTALVVLSCDFSLLDCFIIDVLRNYKFCQLRYVKPHQSNPIQTRPDQARPDQTKPKPSQTRPSQTRPDQTRPDQTRPSQAKPSQTRPDQTRPGQAKPSHVKPSQLNHTSVLKSRRSPQLNINIPPKISEQNMVFSSKTYFSSKVSSLNLFVLNMFAKKF